MELKKNDLINLIKEKGKKEIIKVEGKEYITYTINTYGLITCAYYNIDRKGLTPLYRNFDEFVRPNNIRYNETRNVVQVVNIGYAYNGIGMSRKIKWKDLKFNENDRIKYGTNELFIFDNLKESVEYAYVYYNEHKELVKKIIEKNIKSCKRQIKNLKKSIKESSNKLKELE